MSPLPRGTKVDVARRRVHRRDVSLACHLILASGLRGEVRVKSRILVAHALALGLAALVVVAYAVHGSMPLNALRLPLEAEVNSVVFLPESWAFFTRSPREPRFLVFTRDGASGTWAQAIGLQSDAADGFGLRRRVRALNIEAGSFMTGIADVDWSRCTGDPTICLNNVANAKELTSAIPSPSLCGDVAIVQQDRVPWAWARTASANTMPSKVARLVIKC
jgi:antimicrobial peptide system SdpA family protein